MYIVIIGDLIVLRHNNWNVYAYLRNFPTYKVPNSQTYFCMYYVSTYLRVGLFWLEKPVKEQG